MLTHNDVLVLVESERLVLVDSLNDVLVLVESLTLVDVDNDVLALVESLTLVDAECLMMCLHLLSLKDSYLLIHLMTYLCLLSHSLVDVDP